MTGVLDLLEVVMTTTGTQATFIRMVVLGAGCGIINMPNIDFRELEPKPSDNVCPICGSPLVIRKNRHSGRQFIGCFAYPQCAFIYTLQHFRRRSERFHESEQVNNYAMEMDEIFGAPWDW